MFPRRKPDERGVISVYQGSNENEARKVFDAYVGSNSPVDLMLNGTTILTHENGKVCKPKEDE